MSSNFEIPPIPPLQVPTLLTVGGILFIFLSFTKVSGYINIEVCKGKEIILLVVGLILLILGIFSFYFVFLSILNKETQRKVNIIFIIAFITLSGIMACNSNTQTLPVGDPAIVNHSIGVTNNNNTIVLQRPTGTSTETPPETAAEVPTQTNSQPVAASTPIDISPYLDWNFTIYENSGYSNNPDWSAPEGESYVRVTIHLQNDGNKSISTMPDCWKFISNGTSYSYDAMLTPTDGVMKYEVRPGESFTFEIDYVVKGTPTEGSLSYENPYIEI